MSTTDQNGPDAASAQAAAPASTSSLEPVKSGPLTGSIVWGALVLIFCAYVASREMGSVIDPVTWMIATIIGVGVLLLGVGMVVLLRGSRERR